jgi:hypothetical protein
VYLAAQLGLSPDGGSRVISDFNQGATPSSATHGRMQLADDADEQPISACRPGAANHP